MKIKYIYQTKCEKKKATLSIDNEFHMEKKNHFFNKHLQFLWQHQKSYVQLVGLRLDFTAARKYARLQFHLLKRKKKMLNQRLISESIQIK